MAKKEIEVKSETDVLIIGSGPSGKGAFTLFTGIGGDAWVTAAQKLAVQLDIAINPVMIGPGCMYTDLYGDWPGTSDIE